MEQSDTWSRKAAEFMARALELDLDPAELAGEMVALKRDPNAGISAVELDSSEGPAAFLVYHYALLTTGVDGRTGQRLFDEDVRTLERAAQADLPGPRILAHGTAAAEGFVLATSPSVFRAMTGAVVDPVADHQEEEVDPATASIVRDSAARALLPLLRDANRESGRWLRAIRSAPFSGSDAALQFSEEEAALALFVLDERMVADLLRALNLLIESAKASTETIGDRS